MSDQSFEPTAVAGRGNDRVRLDPRAICEFDTRRVEGLHAADDLDASVLDRLDHLLVHDRRADSEPPQPRERPLAGSGKLVLAQVAEHQRPHSPVKRVTDARRQLDHRGAEEVAGQPAD